MAGMKEEAGEGQEGAERARTVHGNEQGGLQVTSETPGTKSPRLVQRRTMARKIIPWKAAPQSP